MLAMQHVLVQELFACWSLVGQLDVVHARLMSVSSQHKSAASRACHVQGCIAQSCIAIAELAYHAVYRGLLLMVLWCASLVLVPSMLTTSLPVLCHFLLPTCAQELSPGLEDQRQTHTDSNCDPQLMQLQHP